MITVTATLAIVPIEGGNCHFASLPESQSDEIRAQAFASPRGFGSVKVEASIKDVRWRTSVFPQKSGGYYLPVKADVRRLAGIKEGDEVTITLELI